MWQISSACAAEQLDKSTNKICLPSWVMKRMRSLIADSRRNQSDWETHTNESLSTECYSCFAGFAIVFAGLGAAFSACSAGISYAVFSLKKKTNGAAPVTSKSMQEAMHVN